jgi:hypothetical protein
METIKKRKAGDSFQVPSLRTMIRVLFPVTEWSLLNSLTLVNRQIHDEFLLVCCQKAMFSFTLDASHTHDDSFWKVTPSIIQKMHKCTLKILATPQIFGALDPRTVSSVRGDWVLQRRIFTRMATMLRLTDLRLSIEASGDPLWNPIWLWHYTSQSFKESTNTAFRRINFNLQAPILREPNHLARKGQTWEWRCSKDHFVLEDPQGSQPVREFAAALYEYCPICDAPEKQ